MVEPLDDFFAQLRARDIRLYLENGKLKFDAPKGAMDDELLGRLRARKAELVDWLEQEAAADDNALFAVPRNQNLVLTFAQEWFWLNQRAKPENCPFNVPKIFHLRGPLDIPCLQQSANAVIRRHELLRSVYDEIQNMPVQRIRDDLELSLELANHPDLDEAERMDVLKHLTRRELTTPFELRTALPLRMTLIRWAEEAYTLLLCIHHIATDVLSINVFFYELGTFYSALSQHREATLPALPIQNADYAAWQYRRLTLEVRESCLAYWRRWFVRGIPPVLPLASRRPTGAVSPLAATLAYQIPAGLMRRLERLNQSAGTTFFMLFAVVLAVLLYRRTGCDDIVLGVPLEERNHWQLEPLICRSGGLLVLRLDLRGVPNFRTLLAQAREASLAALAHQQLPFWHAIRELELECELPMFQTLLTYIPGKPPIPDLDMDGIEAVPVLPEEVMMLPELMLVGCEEKSAAGVTVRGWWQYKQDLFEARDIVELDAAFQSLLGELAENPDMVINRR